MVERRGLLKSAAMSAAGLMAMGASQAQAKAGTTIELSTQKTYPGVDGKMLVNKPRAHAVMEQYKLDGLIALNPINVYYLTNTVPTMTKFRSDIGGLATFARDPSQPSFLIASNAQAWDIVNGDREVPNLITYSGAANWDDYTNATPEQMKIEPKATVGGYAVRPGVPLTAREQRWAEALKKYNANAAAGPAWAIVRALKESGLTKGRIAVDDMRIAYMLKEIGFDGVTIVPGENIFRYIRMVKSEPEIALMRVAGHNNGVATMKTIRAIEKGMRFDDIERRFRAECAALGSEMTSFIAGVTIGLFPDGEAVEGKPFLIDAVSHFRQYHGDFSRTICIGEPRKDVLERAKANKAGRDAVFAAVKPGVKFSELTKIGFDVQVKAGMPREILIVSPHTLGLEHGDSPYRIEGPFSPPVDHVLEENMVLTVDLPYIEVGWGAGHNEDLIRVTKTGFEFFNTLSDPLEVV
ncbi:MAG: M24 family metallopeptidase [Rhodospirillaceae bacterium]|nr:M24 family metallopeptidase [Rhodospirillaceae bacterium]